MNGFSWLVLWMILAGQSETVRGRLFVQAHIERYGVTHDSTLENRRHREAVIRQLGFGGVGIPFEWFRIEPDRGTFDWRRTDSIVNELADQGLGAYGLLTYSPRWAVPPEIAAKPRSESHRPVVDGSSAKGDTAFARFAAAAARRYHGRIGRWEVWNEENNPAFWFHVHGDTNVGPSAADYALLFTLAQDSIAKAAPGAEVAVGGLASFSGHTRDLTDELDPSRRVHAEPSHQYLRELLALGVKPSAVAIHPYSVLPPGTRARGESDPIFPTQVVDSVFDVLDAGGLATTNVWVSEWGVDARPELTQAAVDSWYRAGLQYLMCHPRVAFVTLYTLTDPNPNTHFGLLNSDGTNARDGQAVRAALSDWPACPQRASSP